MRKVEELKFINTYLKPDNPSKKDYNLIKKFEQNIIEVLSNDLNTPKALAKFWNLIDLETLNPRLKLELILRLDQILGLRLESIKPVNLTEDLKKLIIERESFKGKKQFDKADNIREMLNDKGFEVKDTKLGTILLSKTTQPN